MTKRERNLAILVGGTLGGLALWSAVSRMAVAPFKTVREQITAAQRQQNELTVKLGQTAKVREQYAALTDRTISADAATAGFKFREEIHGLLEAHGLREPFTNELPAHGLPDGVTEVAVSVRANGTLSEIVGFLVDFYQRPYLARIDKIRLTVDEHGASANAKTGTASKPPPRTTPAAGNKSKKSPAGGEPSSPSPVRASRAAEDDAGPRLKLTLTAVTLVAPPIKGIPYNPGTAVAVAGGQGRLGLPVEDYALIYDTNLFKEWKPPKQVVKVDPPDDPPNKNREEGVTPPPPPLPPPAAKKTLVSTSARAGELRALVRNDDKDTEPLQKVQLNDALEDGKVVLIHPRGIVVHVTTARGSDSGKSFFYKLGKPFSDRVELTSAEFPELWAELQTALEQ